MFKIVDAAAIMLLLGFSLTVTAQTNTIKYYDIDPDITSNSTNGSKKINILVRLDSAMTYPSQILTFECSQQHASVHPDINVEVLSDGNGPAPLNLNDAVDISSNWDGYQNQLLGSSGGAGSWSGLTNKYIGVRTKKNGQWHYGWIRIDVDQAPNYIIIKDYAYNTTPGASIKAGQSSTTGIATANNDDFNITVYNKQLRILGVHTADIRMLNAMGQQIQFLKLCKDQYADLTALPAGSYILYIKTPGHNYVQKIFL